MKVVSSNQMRAIENAAFHEGTSSERLMQNAGHAIALAIESRIKTTDGSQLVALIGPGNNGLDGLIACSELRKTDSYITTIILLTNTVSEREDFLEELDLINSNVKIYDSLDCDSKFQEIEIILSKADVVLDAIFGIGLSRNIEDPLKAYINRIIDSLSENVLKVAVDIPTGINTDTGEVDQTVFGADLTFALACPKLAHFTQPAAYFCGKVEVLDIGILIKEMKEINVNLITESFVGSKIPMRPLGSNKGSFGKIMVVGGSKEFVGAPALAGKAALRTGAGLVTSAIPTAISSSFTSLFPESTLIQLPEISENNSAWNSARYIHKNLAEYSVMLIGCGLGVSNQTTNIVENLLIPDIDVPKLIIDADALNILSRMYKWWDKVDDNTILTPHPGEMSRLTSLSINEIQSNRINVAQEFSCKWNKIVVLKGANTVIASPDGEVWVSKFANPALASAGTGDVLAGIIAGLLAQNVSMIDAALLGVYIHGLTGETFGKSSGLLASDLLESIPFIMDRLRINKGFKN